MRKIPTLYQRDPQDMRRVLDVVTPGCEWVLAGEGVPTRKWDGTCVMLDDGGRWWMRREVKPGKAYPPNFVPEDFDPATGKTQGWIPAEQSDFKGPLEEAVRIVSQDPPLEPGTYELCGPKVNGDPEYLGVHWLFRHGEVKIHHVRDGKPMSPRDLIEDCKKAGWEGVVWHHPDGRMAKLKQRDYPS